MNAAGIFTKPARALILASGLIAATSVVGFAQDVTVGLGTPANDPLTNAYVNPPTGMVVLGGHTFDLTSGKMIQFFSGQSASLVGSYPNTKAVYLLMNSYNTFLSYSGATIGTVVLTFSDGTTQTTNLVVGTNLREWRPAGANTVNTATGPGWSNVWTGQALPSVGGGTAVIDMITITVAGTGKTLTGIGITNQDLSGVVGMILPAVTVDDGPVVLPPPTVVPNNNNDEKDHDVNKVTPPVHQAPKPKPTKPADKNHKTVKPVVLKSGSDADKSDQSEKTDKSGDHSRHGED
ncbi:MAG TPA: hypothetical protein VGR77_03380 [Candidatus Dormibacteraeota bacterium]|nr:hypothetical protein [Candidatus Dormibacteraeota bacterium]